MIPEIEKRPKEEIKRFQEERLQELMNYLHANSRFYSDLFKKNGIDHRKIKTMEDLQKIPVTTKTELQNFNDDCTCTHVSASLKVVLARKSLRLRQEFCGIWIEMDHKFQKKSCITIWELLYL